jgi:hypothetical protein
MGPPTWGHGALESKEAGAGLTALVDGFTASTAVVALIGGLSYKGDHGPEREPRRRALHGRSVAFAIA